MEVNTGRIQAKQPTMYTYEYPMPAVTVDIVVFSIREEHLQVLFVKRGAEPFKGKWALPGGFVNLQESLEDAAQRELQEETGVAHAYLEQLYTYGDPERDPRGRVITVAYFALIPTNISFEVEAGSDATSARWFVVAELPELAFDHADIVAYALRRLRYKLEYTAVGFELLPEEFTLSELQQSYEIILGEKLDKRNFRRRILQAGIIEKTPHMRTGEGRPAQLYRYRTDAVAEVKARRLFP
jgi:ADP-ribose pyrophosphatase YjhB (NUDIX family)